MTALFYFELLALLVLFLVGTAGVLTLLSAVSPSFKRWLDTYFGPETNW